MPPAGASLASDGVQLLLSHGLAALRAPEAAASEHEATGAVHARPVVFFRPDTLLSEALQARASAHQACSRRWC